MLCLFLMILETEKQTSNTNGNATLGYAMFVLHDCRDREAGLLLCIKCPHPWSPRLPHEPLHLARFLRPFEPPVQENISSNRIDEKEPQCLKPEPMIMPFVKNSFNRFDILPVRVIAD